MSGTAMKTGIYVRVSTEEQAQEGFSVRAQTEKLKSYALIKEWEIYNIYSDEGISGKNITDRLAESWYNSERRPAWIISDTKLSLWTTI